MSRALGFLFVCTLVLGACGADSLTLSEYSSEIAELINGVDGRLDAHADELFSSPASVEATRAYLEDRVAGYNELVDGVDTLNPPEEAADLHAALGEILGRLLIAEEARAAFAATVDSIDDLDQVWEGAEAQVVREAEQEAILLCYAAQDRIDETEEREDLADVPWIPSEMKEVVRVAFDCPE